MYIATYRRQGIKNARRIEADSVASAKRKASEAFDNMGPDVEILVMDEDGNVLSWRKTGDFRWTNVDIRETS